MLHVSIFIRAKARPLARSASGRDFAGRVGLMAAAAAALAMMAPASTQPAAPQTNPDWPCRQILVSRLAVAAVWSGPPIEGIAWQKDPAVAALAAEVAARRMPLEDAERRIADFAKAQAAAKAYKLAALFAGVFETLDAERAQIIAGLLRFGTKQRELAAKIRSESHMDSSASKEAKDKDKDKDEVKDKGALQLEWDMRLFEERRQSLSFVCESPTLIEQRLFAIARIIQRNLE